MQHLGMFSFVKGTRSSPPPISITALAKDARPRLLGWMTDYTRDIILPPWCWTFHRHGSSPPPASVFEPLWFSVVLLLIHVNCQICSQSYLRCRCFYLYSTNHNGSTKFDLCNYILSVLDHQSYYRVADIKFSNKWTILQRIDTCKQVEARCRPPAGSRSVLSIGTTCMNARIVREFMCHKQYMLHEFHN
jgi:hypothetical protein